MNSRATIVRQRRNSPRKANAAGQDVEPLLAGLRAELLVAKPGQEQGIDAAIAAIREALNTDSPDAASVAAGGGTDDR